MILVRQKKIKEWLKSIGQNQTWLAGQLGVGKAYVSLIISNKCQISKPVISKLMALSHIIFEGLFYSSNENDTRQFFGKKIWWRDRFWNKEEYEVEIENILSLVNGKKTLDKEIVL